MVEINQRNLRDVDWLLLLAPIGLVVFGCIGIASTAPRSELKKQLIALAIGLVAALIVMFTDYRKIIMNVAPFLYGAANVLLVLVLFIGKEVNGNKAWLQVFGFSLQPSEFAKIATILMLARYMAKFRSGSLVLKDILIMAGIVMPPVILIALGHDTGTMLTFGDLGVFYFLGECRRCLSRPQVALSSLGLLVVPAPEGLSARAHPTLSSPRERRPARYVTDDSSVIAVELGWRDGEGMDRAPAGSAGLFAVRVDRLHRRGRRGRDGVAGYMLGMALVPYLIWN